MKQATWLLPFLLITATPVVADVLLGAQVGRQSLETRQTAPGVDVSDTVTTDTALGIIVGVGSPGGGSRITGEYGSFQIGSRVDLGLFNLGYVQMFPAAELGSDLRLRPFLGAELGYGWLKVDAVSPYSNGRDSGPLVGARAGLNLVITERAELEFGLRYSRVGLDAELQGPGTAHYEVESNRGWWIGFNVGL